MEDGYEDAPVLLGDIDAHDASVVSRIDLPGSEAFITGCSTAYRIPQSAPDEKPLPLCAGIVV